MAIPYSNDLRRKVINLIKQGKKQTEISELLSIDKATIFRWNKRTKEVGNPDFKGYHDNSDKIKILQGLCMHELLDNSSIHNENLSGACSRL